MYVRLLGWLVPNKEINNKKSHIYIIGNSLVATTTGEYSKQQQ